MAAVAEEKYGEHGTAAAAAVAHEDGESDGPVLMMRQDSTEGVLEAGGDKVEERASKSASRRRKQQGNMVQRLWRAVRGQENPLPTANPKNWPNPSIEDVRERPTRIVQVNKPQEYTFCDNFIKTSKYEVWSFMPKFLAMEFHPRKKIANLYFLIVSLMQAIPAITSTFGYPILLLPLLFIVLIDMVFTIFEDASRHKADALANAAQAMVLDKATGDWKVKERWEVAVGDFVKVHNRQEVPADMLLVGVHERYKPNYTGACYVETKSLDGETNLKIRQVQKVLLGRVETHKDLESFSGKIIMEHPNKAIASFSGSLEVSLKPTGSDHAVVAAAKPLNKNNSRGLGGRRHVVKEPITSDNLLLRGTVLRNTKWAAGLVISTGHDTKVMMSIAKAPEKSSHLNARINTEIKGLALMLFLFCFTGAMGSSIWQSQHTYFRATVLGQTSSLVSDFLVQFFYYLLLLYGFVPISLYVSQNFIRYFQSWFMDQDLDMYHEPTDTPSRVRTMNLNEDLGQITHVFSDKTGTLTQNVMDFRKCTVAGKSYGKGITEIGQAALKLKGVELSAEEVSAEKMAKDFSAPHVNFYDPMMFQDLQAEANVRGGSGRLTDFLTLLALCHTVIPERPNGGDEIVLSASSPDDEALVLGAKYFGVEFTERVDTSAVIQRTPMPGPLASSGNPVKETHDVLRILGFNSVRKRMSVIVRGSDGKVRVLAKGADTTMIPLLREDTPKKLLDTTMDHLEGFALEGLRTLMVGSKEFSEEDFEEWDEAYDAAINNLTEVAEQQAGRPNKIDDLMAQAEKGLTLLGGTAIEDKLQTGVGDTIEKMVRGGMVVWVITGDKEETAINIGVACQLLWAEERMDRCIINTKTCPTPEAVKTRLVEEFERYCSDMAACKKDGRSCKPRSLVIDGAAFSLIEDSPITSLHGPLDGRQSLLSLSADLPLTDASRTQRQGGGRGGTETPSRFVSVLLTHHSAACSTRAAALKIVRRGSRVGLNTKYLAGGGDVWSSIEAAQNAQRQPKALRRHHPCVDKKTSAHNCHLHRKRISPRAGGALGAGGGVALEAGGVPPGGDEKQEIEAEVIWSLSGTSVVEVEEFDDEVGGVCGGKDLDEEAGVAVETRSVEVGSGMELKKGEEEDVLEVLLDAGDALTAKEALLQFSSVCQAFVGCRMSPDQKRQLVHLIADNNPDARTLAVGDGANDVPMIQAAHVGIGISGQEGLQAVNASDYSLAQFRFLQKLLLCHGRFNYRRMSFASSYLFYKSVSWAVPLFLYAFWNGLSGQVFYDWVNSTLWALLYTGLPIVLLGIYDTDVLPATALRYPWLYRNGVDDELLTKKFFWGWIAQGVLESCWVTIPLMFLHSGGPEFSGETPSVLGFGHTAFQAMTIVVNMKIIFVQRRWHWVEAALLTVSTGLMFGVSWFLNVSTFITTLDWEWYGVQSAYLKDPSYWAVTMFGVFGVLMRDVAWKGYHRWWHPKLHHVLVEMENGHLEDIDLPRSLRRSYSLHKVVQEDTSSRVSKMRTQSLQRMEDHRDAVIQALGASGSGARNYTVSSPGLAAPDAAGAGGAAATASLMRQRLDAVVEDGGRPQSAGGRLMSISSLLEGISRSPMSSQVRTANSAGSHPRGRSAGSSPVLPGLSRTYPGSVLPGSGGGGGGSGNDALVVRYRSSGDLVGLGLPQGSASTAGAGYAFSHDETCSDKQIQMIMRSRCRPTFPRRSSMQPASKLPPIDDSFRAHLRALKAHNVATAAESGSAGGSGSGSGSGSASGSRSDGGSGNSDGGREGKRLVAAAVGSGHSEDWVPVVAEGEAAASSTGTADTAADTGRSGGGTDDPGGGNGEGRAATATVAADVGEIVAAEGGGGEGEEAMAAVGNVGEVVAAGGATGGDGKGQGGLTKLGSSVVGDGVKAVFGGGSAAASRSSRSSRSSGGGGKSGNSGKSSSSSRREESKPPSSDLPSSAFAFALSAPATAAPTLKPPDESE
ncbi:unnamed protein product [Pylaiella littoralis]